MKNIKRVLGIATLMAIVATFAVSCYLSSYKLDRYYDFLFALEHEVKDRDMPASEIKTNLEKANEVYEVCGFKINDTKPGDVKRGTKAKELKKRFQAVVKL